MTDDERIGEIQEQAALYRLGVLEPDDRQAFALRLQGASLPLRQAVTAYQTVVDTLGCAVMSVAPAAALRERVVAAVAQEAKRETAQFERVAGTLALAATPVTPPASLKERLMARIEGHTDVRLDLGDSVHVPAETPVQRRLPQDSGLLSSWLRSCRTVVSNVRRTMWIRSVTARQSSRGLTFIRASEGAWRELAPGVMAKMLSFDSASRRATALLRILPGTGYAPHRHTETEELFVLEGGCVCAGRELKVGDYHRAEAGTEHHDTSSDDGCLLLVISSPHNEMLP